MNRIKQTTEYNGINLLSSSGESVASSGQFIEEITRRDTSGMTTLASVDESISLTSGTHSISTADELSKLATMTNNGLIGENTEFVLANDIDLSAYSTGEGWTPIGSPSKSFTATFDGNGHVISKLYINRPSSGSALGLFGQVDSAEIKNIGLENVSVTGRELFIGGLLGLGLNDTMITNCYVTGSVNGGSYTGGMAGGSDGTIINSYATGSVIGSSYVGGLLGLGVKGSVINSYATGRVTGNDDVGGLLGFATGTTLDNAYYTDTTGQTNGLGLGVHYGTAQLVTMDGLHELISQGILLDYRAKTEDKSSSKAYILQIGINSDSSSQISFELSGIDISALDGLDLEEANALSTIDEVLKSINAEQTKLGALENRLESALEQIGVSYDNLVSTQSTIRDADIAEESSAYIRNQILQQASATLLATANQTPAIALQLL